MALSALNFLSLFDRDHEFQLLLFLVSKEDDNPATLENETLHNLMTLTCFGSWIRWEYLRVEEMYALVQTGK